MARRTDETLSRRAVGEGRRGDGEAPDVVAEEQRRMIAMLEARDAQLVAEAEHEVQNWLDQVQGDHQALVAERTRAIHEARVLRAAAHAESEAVLREAREQACALLEAALAEADRLVSRVQLAAHTGGRDLGH